MKYTIEEIAPEGFHAIINNTGKMYNFNIFSNATALLYQKKWGDAHLSEIFSTQYNEFIGLMAWWLLDDAGKADFASAEAFNAALQPYYLRKADFDEKLLKCLSLCFVKTEETKGSGAKTTGTRFQSATVGRRHGEVAEVPLAERVGNIVFNSPSDANKTV